MAATPRPCCPDASGRIRVIDIRLPPIGAFTRVAARSGILAPRRPDRVVRAGLAVRHWGATLAGAAAAAAALHGDRTAVVDATGRSLGYVELDSFTNALAHGLEARGVVAGTTVGVLARDHVEFVAAAIALAKVGAHTVLLNTGMAAPQLRDVVAREGVDVIIHDDDFDEVVRAADRPCIATSTFADLVASRTTAARRPPGDIGRIVILTSGTTGTPKGARRTAAPPAVASIGMLDAIPYRSGEAMVVAAPLFHSWGFSHLAIGLGTGCPIVLLGRFDPEKALAAIDRHRARVLVAVPVMLQRILEVPPEARREYDTASLRLAPLSGSSIPGGLAERFMNAFGDVIYNLYGSTEAGVVSVATPADLRAAPGTAGRPPAGVAVRIVDDHGADVVPGTTGRIVVRSALVFEGYTTGDSRPSVDGFLATGDTGHVDESGRLFVDGRDDEMIVSGGENVYPREVEDLLSAHPAIREAAVVGVDDSEFGQRLRAFVVRAGGDPADSLDEAAVQAYVRARLARYKVPRDVVFVAELPRNATGKVVTRDLR